LIRGINTANGVGRYNHIGSTERIADPIDCLSHQTIDSLISFDPNLDLIKPINTGHTCPLTPDTCP